MGTSKAERTERELDGKINPCWIEIAKLLGRLIAERHWQKQQDSVTNSSGNDGTARQRIQDH